MQFNSLSYILIYLPIVALGWALLRRTAFANHFLFAASVFFYGSAEPWYLLPLFCTALIDYFVGRVLHNEDRAAHRRFLLLASVVANLGLLSYFKYAPWLSGKLAAALGHVGIPFPIVAVTLPPAISFYTFQSMSYTIDIYRRELKPYRNVVDYLAFITFFPHLVAGPIMRARDLLVQLARSRPLPTAEQVSAALFMILFGLFQKVVVADNMGGIVNDLFRGLFSGREQMGPGIGLIYAYAFAIQIYCDFAAYSTIARGSAKLFNVELMRNFATPYFSSSPSEFWQRWHISLSTWLRDYLYIPLGGNRHGALTTYRNLMLTMAIGGLWHGAGIMFIVWGVWHGALLVLYRIFPIDKWLSVVAGRTGRVIAIIIFFHLVCIGWIFFRTGAGLTPQVFSSIAQTGLLLVDPSKRAHFLTYVWPIAIFWGPMLIFDYIGWMQKGEFVDVAQRLRPAVRALLSIGLLYAIVFFGRREANEFIYFAF